MNATFGLRLPAVSYVPLNTPTTNATALLAWRRLSVRRSKGLQSRGTRPGNTFYSALRTCYHSGSRIPEHIPLPRTRCASSTAASRICSSLRAQSAKTSCNQQRLQSGISLTLAAVPLVVLLSCYLLYEALVAAPPDQSTPRTTEKPAFYSITDPRDDSVALPDSKMVETRPGHLGNLTPDQEAKLFELWRLLFFVCGVEDQNSEAAEPASLQVQGKTTTDTDKPKKKRMSLFKRKDKVDKKENADISETSSVNMDHFKDDADDKYGQTKEFRETLATRSPASIRETLWNMTRMDHPDALLLRFLRARKWDVQKALVMLVSTMKWRQDFEVDDDIIANGEEYFRFQEEQDPDAARRKFAEDFLTQMRMGKSFCRGVDKEGRPISVVRARLHRQGEQSNESLERYTVYLIETARLLLMQPADTACIVFDMTGFSLANMDHAPVKFMIQCFEANYPESLGTVLIHKAPWIFQGVWKIIRGWLDPVVAGKVHFTNNLKELSAYVPENRITEELGGRDPWEYRYVEAVIGENARMKDTATRDKIVEQRESLFEQYEAKTWQCIREHDAARRTAVKHERAELATKLGKIYWDLDPYIRSRSYYDRIGILQEGGGIEYFPESKPPARKNGPNGSVPAMNGSIPLRPAVSTKAHAPTNGTNGAAYDSDSEDEIWYDAEE